MYRSLAVSTCFALGFGALAASAATVSFDLDDQQGSESLVSTITLTDVAAGQVRMDVEVTDPINQGDILAVFFNLGGDGSISGYINGAGNPVTGLFANTNGTGRTGLGGNIGEVFEHAVRIGGSGSAGEFWNSFSFTLLGTNLDVSDFIGQTFAVRGQTVGPCATPFVIGSCDGEGSAKNFGTASDMAPVPLPATGLLLLAGMGGIAALRRRRRAA